MIDWSAHAASRTRRLKPSAIREILKLTQTGDVISFAGGLPAPELFPVAEIEDATRRVLAREGASALQYSTTEGHAALREWVAARHSGAGTVSVPDAGSAGVSGAGSHGVPGVGPAGASGTGAAAEVDGSWVQIVSGAQQGLDLVAKCYLDPGDTVVVAAPTYPGALRAFDPYEVRYRAVDTDGDGFVVESLEAALAAGAKLIYVIPTFDNPSGVSLNLERRHAVIELARRYGVPILEDNPYGELRFDGDELPHLFDLAPEQVIHVGTFSKTMVPGLRLGWLVATPDALAPVRHAKQAADLHTSTLAQMVAVEVAGDGFRDEHLLKIRDHYRSRRDLMLQALERHLGAGCRWTRPEGGMFIWLTVPDGLDTMELAREAVDAGVAYVPGHAFYPDGGGANGLRLSYSVATPEQIESGVAILGQLLRSTPGSE
ncbi:PLP-dependent aminotransferase family protein [Actinobacteria bacterium YIM 96077]|uniref:Aminotransferase class I/classII large domain-containing protein n=2 Tax=Phytoactinopolyspora halophila TaxID=1981511 RepID=A0A329QV75_9ACTN|nr:PLP-dependent aminotransferase family protein [Actinobacteria bacterium YIM 96077]RAW16344.1 hypothetical protein DPM12_06795 [Phytoactinopolyspora halophila]